jgi:hypothetical protein
VLRTRSDAEAVELARALDVSVFAVACRLPRLLRKLREPVASPQEG